MRTLDEILDDLVVATSKAEEAIKAGDCDTVRITSERAQELAEELIEAGDFQSGPVLTEEQRRKLRDVSSMTERNMVGCMQEIAKVKDKFVQMKPGNLG